MREQVIEAMAVFVAANVAVMDCVGSCPDEVTIAAKEGRGNIRTDAYCNKCFARQIVNQIEKAGYRCPERGIYA